MLRQEHGNVTYSGNYDRPTTDQPTDQQTDMRGFIGKLHFQRMMIHIYVVCFVFLEECVECREEAFQESLAKLAEFLLQANLFFLQVIPMYSMRIFSSYS